MRVSLLHTTTLSHTPCAPTYNPYCTPPLLTLTINTERVEALMSSNAELRAQVASMARTRDSTSTLLSTIKQLRAHNAALQQQVGVRAGETKGNATAVQQQQAVIQCGPEEGAAQAHTGAHTAVDIAPSTSAGQATAGVGLRKAQASAGVVSSKTHAKGAAQQQQGLAAKEREGYRQKYVYRV